MFFDFYDQICIGIVSCIYSACQMECKKSLAKLWNNNVVFYVVKFVYNNVCKLVLDRLMQIKKILQDSSKELKDISKTPDLDSEVLLCFVLKKSKEWIYANLDKELTKKRVEQFEKLLLRRKKSEPIAYIIGKKNFFELEFYVDDRVLIPRPETEILVEEVMREARIMNHELRIADIGTGSGCIAIALAKNLKRAKIFAIDASKKALQVARKNVDKYRVKKQVKLFYGDLLRPLGQDKVDIICANLPYLTIEQLGLTEKDVRDYEPKKAFIVKKETDLYERLLEMAPKYLNKNGIIFLEIDPVFGDKLAELAKLKMPKAKIEIKKDLAEKDRVMKISTQL